MVQLLRASFVVLLLLITTVHSTTTTTGEKKFICIKDLTVERMSGWSGNVKYKLSRQLISDFTNWIIEVHFDQPVYRLQQWSGTLDKTLHVIHEEERVFFIKQSKTSRPLSQKSSMNAEMIAQYSGVLEPKIQQATLCGDTFITASYPTQAPPTQIFPTLSTIGVTPHCVVKGQTWNGGMKDTVEIPINRDTNGGWVIELKFSAPWKQFHQYSCKHISTRDNTYICHNLSYNGHQSKGSVMDFKYQISYGSEQAKLEEVWFNTGYHCKVL